MRKKTLTAWIVMAGLAAGGASAQTTATTTGQQTDLPTFHVVVVGRETKAINFRPRSGDRSRFV